MTSKVIECPYCEVRLTILEPRTETVITCPGCQQSFGRNELLGLEASSTLQPLQNAVRLTPEALVTFDKSIFRDFSLRPQLSASLPPSPAATPSRAVKSHPGDNPANLTGQADPVIAAAAQANLPTISIQSSPEELQLNQHSAESVHSTILKRKKSQRLFYFVLNSLLAVLTLIFAGFLIWKVNSTEPHGPSLQDSDGIQTVQTTKSNDPGANAPGVEAKPEDQSKLAADENATRERSSDSLKPQETLPAAPPPRPVFQIFTAKQVDEIWKTAKPNLVLLDISGPLGKQRAVGTIVDSRGWILTSYRAVKDAWQIEVTASSDPLDKTAQTPPLIDLARGIVTQDSTRDLAILAINRRFVVSLAEVTLAQRDRLVPQMRLLSAAPPTNADFYGVQEVQVDRRSKGETLSPEIQSRIRHAGIGTNDLEWLTMRGKSEWLAGTPLFDDAGVLQAMVSLPHDDLALAVSVHQVKTLLSSAAGNVTPFKQASNQIADATAALEQNHAIPKRIEDLNRMAEFCRQFDWLPATENQYQTLIDYFQSYLACKDYLSANPPDYRDGEAVQTARDNLETRLAELRQELLERLRQALEQNDDTLKSLNQYAAQDLKTKPNRLVAFWGNVHVSGLQFDQFIMQLNGNDTYCIVPFDPTAQVMRPGSHWLMIAETTAANEPATYRVGERRVLAHAAVQRTEIGPLPTEPTNQR